MLAVASVNAFVSSSGKRRLYSSDSSQMKTNSAMNQVGSRPIRIPKKRASGMERPPGMLQSWQT